MGNALTPRLENAEKTGVLQLSGLKLTKLELWSVSLDPLSVDEILICLFASESIRASGPRQFPVELFTLTKLETLSANRNCLVSLVPPGHVVNFGALRSLRFVHLSMNQLTEFPVELCTATIPINMLDLSHNMITAVPSCVSTLQAIELNLNNNRINLVASTIAQCPRLKVLRLESNQLTLEQFPKELFTESQVSLLCVTENKFDMRDFYSLPDYAQTTFSYVVSQLPAEVAAKVIDVIDLMPVSNPYDTLEAAVIKRTLDSDGSNLQKLLSGDKLGDCTPS
ncbi:leucine-rich repeat-containing protein 57 [Clonorchis sinensis]|uniref:Leucine-rich repeat-containing protein 57 n=1 Tax=Clonorchis sinensis TaxID=79923 RepID=G7Y4L4_CLOSI|nr:leucine-rich repeat-containing protein 57 [Clonorchis sinensis]